MNRLIRNTALKIFSACFLACACTPPPQNFDSGFLVMGTTAELALMAPSATQALKLEQSVEHQLQQQARDWYAFTTGSQADEQGELKQLNTALKAGQDFEASDSLIGLLEASQHWHQLSDGYFDPAVASLVRQWGFSGENNSDAEATPDAAALQTWVANRPRLADLHIDGHRISSTRRDLQLDLGAIAKGYALDQAMKLLHDQQATDALLNLGGQVVAMGTRMTTKARTVQIRAPGSEHPLAELVLQSGESLATSGDYERSREVNGQHLHHLLDPHTGAPVQHTHAVTVLAPNATLADAASTALMAAGPDHWRRIAKQMGIREALRVDVSGRIEVSAAMYARLRWLTPSSASITLVDLSSP